MRNFNFVLVFCLLVCTVACSRANLSGTVTGTTGDKVLFLKQSNDLRTVDSLVLSSDGKFNFSISLDKDERDFFYLYMGERKLASLLLSGGESVSVQCDTLGNWSVEGSEECSNMLANEKALAELETHNPLTYRDFTEHYRKMVVYVCSHSKSLTTIPVFFQKIQDIAVFGLPYDGVIMNNIADSLETVYPGSPYIEILRSAAKTRIDVLQRNVIMNNALSVDFPDIEFADIDGNVRKLSESMGKKTLLVFWNPSDMANKLYNQDVLLPIYEKYEGEGLEIYQVGLASDAAPWKLSVRQQSLPWTNVFDAAGRSAGLYGLEKLPSVFLFEGTKLSRIEKPTIEGIKAALNSKR